MGAIFLNGDKYPYPVPNNSNAYYDYYFENIPCLSSSPASTILNIPNTASILNASEVRDWEAIINFENHQNDSKERSPFGISENKGYGESGLSFELYVKGQNSNTYIYHKYIDGTSTSHDDIIGIGNLNNTDIVFKKTGSNLDIFVNNTVVLTISFNITGDSNTRNAILGSYAGATTYYHFVGIINKFGFKWLN